MRGIRWFNILIIAQLFFFGCMVWAKEYSIQEIIKIRNGINYVDLNGDGKKDIVISGHRHNITAHSFQVYSFYINAPIKVESEVYNWQIVAIEDKNRENYIINTVEGAECILKDIRLLKLTGDKRYYLVIAERLTGETYTDEGIFIFKFFQLQKDEIENRYIYKKVFERKSFKKYCDANQAFLELKTQKIKK